MPNIGVLVAGAFFFTLRDVDSLAAGFPLSVGFLETFEGSLLTTEGFCMLLVGFLVTAPCLPTDEGVLLTLVSGFRTDVGIFLALAGCFVGVFAFTFSDDVLRRSVIMLDFFLLGGDFVELLPFGWVIGIRDRESLSGLARALLRLRLRPPRAFIPTGLMELRLGDRSKT